MVPEGGRSSIMSFVLYNEVTRLALAESVHNTCNILVVGF